MYPGWVTGKLSDVASLIAFPLLAVAATCEWRAEPGPGRSHLVGWVVATGTVMATINVVERAAWSYRWGLGLAQWPCCERLRTWSRATRCPPSSQ